MDGHVHESTDRLTDGSCKVSRKEIIWIGVFKIRIQWSYTSTPQYDFMARLSVKSTETTLPLHYRSITDNPTHTSAVLVTMFLLTSQNLSVPKFGQKKKPFCHVVNHKTERGLTL